MSAVTRLRNVLDSCPADYLGQVPVPSLTHLLASIQIMWNGALSVYCVLTAFAL